MTEIIQPKELAPANEPWNLIRQAIEDLEAIENLIAVCKENGVTPPVSIDMGDWHDVSRNSKTCYVCLAGAVMDQRLGVDRNEDKDPREFEDSIANRLWALDHFRIGYIENAYKDLGIDVPKQVPSTVKIAHYGIDPETFKEQMLELADTLEAAHKEQPK